MTKSRKNTTIKIVSNRRYTIRHAKSVSKSVSKRRYKSVAHKSASKRRYKRRSNKRVSIKEEVQER